MTVKDIWFYTHQIIALEPKLNVNSLLPLAALDEETDEPLTPVLGVGNSTIYFYGEFAVVVDKNGTPNKVSYKGKTGDVIAKELLTLS